MQLTTPPRGVEIFLVLVVLVAAWYDIRYRRIPNWLTAPAVLFALALNAFIYNGFHGFSFSFAGLAVSMGVYLFLYVLRAMGAGDVKLMAAVGAFVGWHDWLGIFILTALFGGALGLIVVILRRRLKSTVWNVGFILSELKSGRPAYVGKEELDVRSSKSLGMPHGAVIAAGTIFFMVLAARFGQ